MVTRSEGRSKLEERAALLRVIELKMEAVLEDPDKMTATDGRSLLVTHEKRPSGLPESYDPI